MNARREMIEAKQALEGEDTVVTGWARIICKKKGVVRIMGKDNLQTGLPLLL